MPRYLRDGPGLLPNCQRGGGLLTGDLVSVAGTNPPKVRVRAMIYIYKYEIILVQPGIEQALNAVDGCR